jgi:D-sedoheptulose 7-phosphate isomerase
LGYALKDKIISPPTREFAISYLSGVCRLINNLNISKVEKILDVLSEACERESTIYFMGNGGSAAIASHYANDLRVGTRLPGYKPFKAVSLTDNTSIITALANDEGYENIFVRQLEGVLQTNDVMFALSVSGNSHNVLKAIKYAKEMEAITISCTGFDGGELKQITDINLHMPTNYGVYGPVEDIFTILGHLIYSYLKSERNRII